jgi:CBS domain-containing protein
MTEERIGSVMRTDFLRLRPAMAIREAVAQMLDARCSAAPVVDETDSLVGIVTQKDCFRPALNASYYQQWSGTVAERMNTDIHTLDAGTDFVTAADAFIERPFRSYPVLKDGRLVGMLDRSDLLAVFLRFG